MLICLFLFLGLFSLFCRAKSWSWWFFKFKSAHVLRSYFGDQCFVFFPWMTSQSIENQTGWTSESFRRGRNLVDPNCRVDTFQAQAYGYRSVATHRWSTCSGLELGRKVLPVNADVVERVPFPAGLYMLAFLPLLEAIQVDQWHHSWSLLATCVKACTKPTVSKFCQDCSSDGGQLLGGQVLDIWATNRHTQCRWLVYRNVWSK